MGLSVWNKCSVHSWTGATRGGGCGCAGVGEGAICTLPSVPHHLKPFPNLTAAVPPPLPMLKPKEIRKKNKNEEQRKVGGLAENKRIYLTIERAADSVYAFPRLRRLGSRAKCNHLQCTSNLPAV